MKKFLFLSLSIIFFEFSSNAQFNAPCASATSGNGVAHEAFFVSADTGFIAGEAFGKGIIQKTVDGGQTWNNVYTTSTSLEWLYDVFFINNSNGFVVGENGKILKTTDGGSTWNSQTIPSVLHFNSVYFPTPQIGYAVGDGNPQGPIYKTTNGGATWSAQTSGATSFLDDVFFVDIDTGYAAGDKDILKTVNGGATWTNVSYTGDNYERISVFCSSANTCYVGGFGIIKTTNGGSTWSPLTLPTLNPPNVYFITSIDFTNSQIGYAAGVIYDTSASTAVNGVILKTGNAGQTWSNINSPANNTLLQNKILESVDFVDAQTGYVAGDKGVILKTINAGCAITVSVTTTNSSCGNATGTATASASSGTPPYTYVWTNGDKGTLADTLSAGLYMVYVSDASGCTAQAPAMINDAGAPTISVALAKNLTCNGSEDGAISVSVTGGIQPYTYLWADGNTTTSQTGLDAGPHQFQVTDANGCMANKIIVLTEPNAITLQDSIKNASCGGNDGAAGVLPSGGTSPYTYLWNTSATTQFITNVSAGTYSVMVTDKNGCTKDGMGSIINVGAAIAKIDSVHPARCSTGVGDIFISVTGGTPPYTYLWNTGATTKNLIGVPAGNYGVTIYSNGNPCTGALNGTLPPYIAPAPAICIVTVDTATGKNVCAFVKDSIANKQFKQYNFFRESTTAGVYQWLGSKPANQLSVWTDPSANPLSRAWRYKITAEDSCGNESPISGHHKTIHCAANIGVGNVVNLAWDDYEGFSYGTFIIYRYTPATGWDSLDAVPSNLHAYTDLNPPTPITNVFYFIAVGNPNQCIPSVANPGDGEKINPQIMAINLNSSKSNVYKVNPSSTTGANENSLATTISVYPNPSNGQFTIYSSQLNVKNIEAFNLYGEKIFSETVNKKQESIHLDQSTGIYFMKIRTDNGTVTKKIIINK